MRASAKNIGWLIGTIVRAQQPLPCCAAPLCRGFLALGLLLSLSTAPAQSQAGPEDGFENYLGRAVALQRKGDLEGARRIYQDALKSYPDRVELTANLGQVLLRLGEYDGAVVYLSKATSAVPDNAALRFSLGLATFQNGQPDKAVDEFRRVLAHAPNHLDANRLLGYCLLQTGELDEALTTLEGVYKRQPSNLDLVYTLASAYLRANRLDPLGELVKGALRDDDSAQALYLRGAYAAAQKNYRQAFADLERARERNAKLPGLDSQLAYTHVLVGDYEAAIQLFESALAMDPADFNANAFLGWLYRERGEVAKATRLLERARRVKPEDTGVLFQLGLIQHAGGSIEQARVLLEKVVAKEPDLKEAHVVLAQVYFAQKRLADAQRERKVIARLQQEEQQQQPEGRDLLYNGLAAPRVK